MPTGTPQRCGRREDANGDRKVIAEAGLPGCYPHYGTAAQYCAIATECCAIVQADAPVAT